MFKILAYYQRKYIIIEIGSDLEEGHNSQIGGVHADLLFYSVKTHYTLMDYIGWTQ